MRRGLGAGLRVIATACIVAGISSGCTVARFVPPVGTPEPLPDGAAIWASATAACRAIEAFGAELRVSGRIDGSRVPGLTIGLAVEREGRVAMEGRYAAASVFSLRGTTEAATLVQTEGRRVTTGRTEAILDALIGIPLDPARLLAVLSGCVSVRADVIRAERVGAVLRVTSSDAVTYLERTAGHWQVRAGTFDRWAVDVVRRNAVGPHRIQLRSADDRSPVVDLALTVVSSDTVRRDPSVFTPLVPAGAQPLSLDGLRESGPLGRRP